MNTQHSHQSGFGIVGILAIVVAVIVIGSAGVLVFRHQRHTKTDAMTSPSSSTATPKSLSDDVTAQPATPVSPAPTQVVKSIPELGLRLTVPASLSDLTYSVSEVQLSNGKTARAVSFSTDALTKADAKCSAKAGPLGAIILGDGQYPSDSDGAAMDYGRLLKQFSTSFAGFSTPQGGCSTEPAALRLSGDAINEFHQAVQTVELSQ